MTFRKESVWLMHHSWGNGADRIDQFENCLKSFLVAVVLHILLKRKKLWIATKGTTTLHLLTCCSIPLSTRSRDPVYQMMEPVMHLQEKYTGYDQKNFVKLMYMKLILSEGKIQPVRAICSEVIRPKGIQLQMPCPSVLTVTFLTHCNIKQVSTFYLNVTFLVLLDSNSKQLYPWRVWYPELQHQVVW
jgi:hypothetical protein